MKRNTVVLLGIVTVGLVLTALIAAIITALRDGGESMLHPHVLSAKAETNGCLTVTFLMTNGSSQSFPWLATTTPNGPIPYYVVQTRTREGWSRTTPFTNYWFSHHLLADASWEFQLTLPASDRVHSVVFFYTVGQRDGPWLVRQTHNLLKNLTLEKDQHELRSPILEAGQIGAASGSQPVSSETHSTSGTAAPRR